MAHENGTLKPEYLRQPDVIALPTLPLNLGIEPARESHSEESQ